MGGIPLVRQCLMVRVRHIDIYLLNVDKTMEPLEGYCIAGP